MDLGLKGRRALITGGAGGIGSAIARALADEGVDVAVNDVGHSDRAEALVAALKSQGRGAMTLPGDISDADNVDRMFRTLNDTWGGLDILINNAGIDGKRALSWDVDPDDWTRVLDINLKGAFLCARAALKTMIPARRGVILNTTSVHEQIAWSGYSAYAASKAGLSMMAKTLAQEAAPFGVRVLSIAPGAIRTSINKAVWQDVAGNADLIRKIPMARLGTPEEVAAMAVVLVSDRASYVTATTVFVDGGMTDYPSFAHGG